MENRKELYEQWKKEHPETLGEKDKHYDTNNFCDWLCEKLKQKEERISELETLSDKKLIGIISQVINRFDEHRKEVDLYIADKDWHYWVGGEQGDVKVRIEQVLDLFTNHQLSDCENELRTGIEELLKQ